MLKDILSRFYLLPIQNYPPELNTGPYFVANCFGPCYPFQYLSSHYFVADKISRWSPDFSTVTTNDCMQFFVLFFILTPAHLLFLPLNVTFCLVIAIAFRGTVVFLRLAQRNSPLYSVFQIVECYRPNTSQG